MALEAKTASLSVFQKESSVIRSFGGVSKKSLSQFVKTVKAMIIRNIFFRYFILFTFLVDEKTQKLIFRPKVVMAVCGYLSALNDTSSSGSMLKSFKLLQVNRLVVAA